QTLGDKAGTIAAAIMADTMTRAAPPAAPATKDTTCWRVQVAAPNERGKADALRSAAESLLLVPMVIEPEQGLNKVRTRDCLTMAGADSLKRRATVSSFSGAFRFSGKKP